MNLADLTPGTPVRYHPIIGGKHDGNLYTVLIASRLHGQDVAWLKEKAGCVSVRALSTPQPGADNYGLPQEATP